MAVCKITTNDALRGTEFTSPLGDRDIQIFLETMQLYGADVTLGTVYRNGMYWSYCFYSVFFACTKIVIVNKMIHLEYGFVRKEGLQLLSRILRRDAEEEW